MHPKSFSELFLPDSEGPRLPSAGRSRWQLQNGVVSAGGLSDGAPQGHADDGREKCQSVLHSFTFGRLEDTRRDPPK